MFFLLIRGSFGGSQFSLIISRGTSMYFFYALLAACFARLDPLKNPLLLFGVTVKVWEKRRKIAEELLQPKKTFSKR